MITCLFLMICFSLWAEEAETKSGGSVTWDPSSIGENGYIIDIDLKYKFINCYGDIRLLLAYEQKNEPSVYVFEEARYNASEFENHNKDAKISQIKLTADLFFDGFRLGQVKMNWITNFLAGCFGDNYDPLGQLGLEYKEYKDKLNRLSLGNFQVIDASSSNSDIVSEIRAKYKEQQKHEQKQESLSGNIGGASRSTRENESEKSTSESRVITYSHVANNLPNQQVLHVGHTNQGDRVLFTTNRYTTLSAGSRYKVNGKVNEKGILLAETITSDYNSESSSNIENNHTENTGYKESSTYSSQGTSQYGNEDQENYQNSSPKIGYDYERDRRQREERERQTDTLAEMMYSIAQSGAFDDLFAYFDATNTSYFGGYGPKRSTYFGINMNSFNKGFVGSFTIPIRLSVSHMPFENNLIFLSDHYLPRWKDYETVYSVPDSVAVVAGTAKALQFNAGIGLGIQLTLGKTHSICGDFSGLVGFGSTSWEHTLISSDLYLGSGYEWEIRYIFNNSVGLGFNYRSTWNKLGLDIGSLDYQVERVGPGRYELIEFMLHNIEKDAETYEVQLHLGHTGLKNLFKDDGQDLRISDYTSPEGLHLNYALPYDFGLGFTGLFKNLDSKEWGLSLIVGLLSRRIPGGKFIDSDTLYDIQSEISYPYPDTLWVDEYLIQQHKALQAVAFEINLGLIPFSFSLGSSLDLFSYARGSLLCGVTGGGGFSGIYAEPGLGLLVNRNIGLEFGYLMEIDLAEDIYNSNIDILRRQNERVLIRVTDEHESDWIWKSNKFKFGIQFY